MSQAVAETDASPARSATSPVVNDVVIKIATPNGSGSQSANLILMRSIFTLGLPVGAKNLFPSNIQGLPTWFIVRVNEHGWLAHRRRTDLMVAMNPQTAAEDIAELEPGAMLVIDETLKPLVKRDDLHAYFIPFNALVKKACPETRLRKMVVNVMYVGVLASILGIPFDEIAKAVDWQFAKKLKAAELNKTAALATYTWAEEHLPKQSPHRLERRNLTKDKIVIEGNEASALGMLFGGVTFLAWYPITPSSSLCEHLIRYLGKHRHDPDTGQATYAVVQAEDELASMGMVIGAGWAGARAFTATSGPGVSLMAEMAGLAYFAEVPSVIVDVQRMGPSTGLPTRTSQGDVGKAYNLSHGDCKHVLLIPGNMRECFEFAEQALELAEKLQTLVFLMSDLDLAMNKWMSDTFTPPTKPLARGKVLNALELSRNGEFARYRDVDGDGIPYRTLPGTDHPNAAYFARGTGHTEKAVYSEKPEDWQRNIDRLQRKFDTAREIVPQPVVDDMDGAVAGIIAYGSSNPAVSEARHILESEHGIKTSYLRIRALPVNGKVKEFCERHQLVCVVEQNRDGQVASILRSEYPEFGTRLKTALHYNGMPIDADTVVHMVLQRIAEQKGKE
jgi:2-oxoglutarate ferredoxin oxidoreductase subunit alpha